MTSQHSDYDERLERQYRRLGTRSPICVGCSERDPFCLERHHLGGQKHHKDVAIVCRNCHRKLTNQQQDHTGGREDIGDSFLTTIRHYLLGLCDLLVMVVNTLREFAKWLIDASQARPS
jgi:hypothetical protein